MKTDSYMPVRIISGRGCVKENSKAFSSLGKRCLIVAGGSSAKKCGALDDCVSALEKEGVFFEVFDRIEPNPKTSACFEAGKRARETEADFIVGIGGGSPMDAAKAAAIYAANASMGETDIYFRSIPAPALPVALIGTTAGTGSEVTGVSVLTNSVTGKKKSISGADCYAKISFCDYGYTLDVPEKITVSTALDAFSHAFESRVSEISNELSACYADKAIALLKDFILGLGGKTAPDEAEREKLYTASIFAGLAINITGTCFPHTVGYHLTEKYGVPHGVACVAFMPELIKRAQKNCPGKLGAVEGILGIGSEELISKTACAVGYEMKITEEEADAFCASLSGNIKNFVRSPGGFTAGDAKRALLTFGSFFN
ncbi:MAG: iron-containing alcohol dehydrogenase [Clostridia bacterium]|nr:iron-containing alcohol dehydrogenase [Clostridia bacterium]